MSKRNKSIRAGSTRKKRYHLIHAKSIRFLRPVHTFSIVARDSRTGDLGVGVQSHWFSVGADVLWAEAGVGAVATQAFAEPSYGPRGLELMRSGKCAFEALKELISADQGEALRQVAMVDAAGRVGVHTGKRCVDFAGHATGDGFSAQANLMLNDGVPDAMAHAFEKADGELADRLMAALEAAQEVGGDIRGMQSAAMLVVKAQGSGKPWADRLVDLRVDDHPEPLMELRRLLNVARSYQHANAGDAAVEKKEFRKALKEYRTAMRLVGGNMEIAFWSALTLAAKGRVKEALPLFRRVFSSDSNWVEVLKRLPKAGVTVSDDAEGRALVRRILKDAYLGERHGKSFIGKHRN